MNAKLTLLRYATSPVQSTHRQLAILGGYPAFPPGSSVPLIQVQGYRPKGDSSAVDAVLANEANEDSKSRPSQQRFVSKILPGVGEPGASYRVTLQSRIGEFLKLDTANTSVICVTSGTNAIRAVLKGVHAKGDSEDCKEVIVPATTAGATIEAVIEEGFEPVFVDVDPASWHLSYEGTKRAISNKTAAIITVDWLGTQCALGPFRKLADKHGIPLISDSAQSFGATNGQPPSIGLAHATIYSLDPTGILRREALAEPNAFVCLRALESLIDALEKRGAAGKLYRRLLGAFGLNAKVLCNTPKAENVHCSTERMPCVGAIDKLASRGRVGGDLKHSRLLATTSVTLPISNMMTLETVETICGLIKLIQHKAGDILEANKGEVAPAAPRGSADVMDLESKYRLHLVIPILDSANSMYSKVFVPRDHMLEHKISIDEFLARFRSQRQWKLNERVLAELRVDTIIGTTVILAPHGAGRNSASPVALDGGGSSATVTLVPGPEGKLTVRKSATGYGIDGNGAPWLRLQSLFLSASRAVKKTGMWTTKSSSEAIIGKLFDYSADGDFHTLTIQQHPGLDTTNGAALTLLPALISDKVVKKWIDQVEHHGARSFELRVRVGEAAHFVADCACALGRGTPWRVVPLFLLGLEKLNDVVTLLDGKAQLSVDNESVSYDLSRRGSSSRSQFTGRNNDKLLSPGSFGISPLHLAVLQANQLPFPKPGRWVVENDSFFLLSRPLALGGDDVCLLATKRPTSGSSSSWRVCVDGSVKEDGRLFAKHFRDIEAHERGSELIRTTSGLSVPHHLAKQVARREDDYSARTSPLLVDIVLPREYLKLLANVRSDARLSSLAYAGAAVQWLQRNAGKF
ncbi:uncharacterized protein Triagg1_7273 [Trichoderma aggressivum f. europaeum]|uniref:Pyridoxal phosphate-dependent transferase n=1 Tax=Trichoderma aggressivum f. europaeum TaxID=173218 RepID=A0AAE1IE21_9HYPO|nr:hypothetical protein Triagg1_7273 [Trichoderma aggressivum f. europaeum]